MKTVLFIESDTIMGLVGVLHAIEHHVRKVSVEQGADYVHGVLSEDTEFEGSASDGKYMLACVEDEFEGPEHVRLQWEKHDDMPDSDLPDSNDPSDTFEEDTNV